MYRSFGEEFRNLAEAADIICEAHFKDLVHMVKKYIRKRFGVRKIEMLTETLADRERGLVPL